MMGDRAGAQLASSAGAGQAHPRSMPAGRGCSTPSYKMRQSSWQISKKKKKIFSDVWSAISLVRPHFLDRLILLFLGVQQIDSWTPSFVSCIPLLKSGFMFCCLILTF